MIERSRCVIFDLDGTLADTIKDIANSVNLTREDYGLPSLPIDRVVSYTGDGARKLLERSFTDKEIDLDEGLERMIRHYYNHPVIYSTLYPGVAEGLAELKRNGWKLAVLTNKPGIVAREILKTLGIAPLLNDVIGGNDGFPLKPDPGAVFHLLEKYHAAPENSWILGDNHTDMNSAVQSGLNGMFATWGFGFLGDALCKAKANSFAEFVKYIQEEKA